MVGSRPRRCAIPRLGEIANRIANTRGAGICGRS